MKTSELFRAYIWLIDTIKEYGEVTFEDINEEWVETEMSGGVEMARSTFNRHRDAIADMFGVYIECNRSRGNTYYISNGHVLEDDTIQSWMLSTLTISNRIHESKSLHERVLLEDAPTDYLLDIVMESMRKGVKLEMGYNKYGLDTTPVVVIEPYCLKMFRSRWYVLGLLRRDVHDRVVPSFSLFALDKVKWLRLTDAKFALPKDFCAKDYFADYFGAVVFDGTKPERVVLRAYGREAQDIGGHALHGSQEKLHETEGYTDFKYYLCPTTDFRDYIIGRGRRLKVLSPKWLADEIRYSHQEAANAYEEDGDN